MAVKRRLMSKKKRGPYARKVGRIGGKLKTGVQRGRSAPRGGKGVRGKREAT